MKLLRLARGQWEVLAPCEEDGRCPVLEFLMDLEGKSPAGMKMLNLLRHRVPSGGPPNSSEISKKLRDGIFEFRRDQVRVLWFYDQGRVVVCTHGFWKQEQKLPDQEIDRAMNVRRVYVDAKTKDKIETLDMDGSTDE